MSALGYDNILCAVYLVAWIATLIWYQCRRNTIDAGTAIISLQVVYGVFSIISLNDPLFSAAYDELRLFPFIYLFVMMLIALSPVIYNHLHPSDSIAEPKTRVLGIIAIVLCITALLQIPDMMSDSGNGIVKIITDNDAGKEAYTEQVENVSERGSAIHNLPAVIFNMLADFAPFLLFYYLTLKRKHWILLTSLAIAVIIGLMLPVSRGQRGGVITTMLALLGAYFLYRRYLSRKINMLIQSAIVAIVLLVSIPVTIITISRFEKESAGVGGFVSWYVGQGNLYFNNHGLDAGGIRYGDRTMNLLKRAIDPSTPKNFAERRDKYSNLELDDSFFSTFVGDFTIDYGPVAAFVIFVVFNLLVIRAIRPRDKILSLQQLLLIYIVICINIKGGMTLFPYSDTNNLQLITFAMLYVYLNYHDILLERFPLKTSTNEKGNTENT